MRLVQCLAVWVGAFVDCQGSSVGIVFWKLWCTIKFIRPFASSSDFLKSAQWNRWRWRGVWPESIGKVLEVDVEGFGWEINIMRLRGRI